MDEFGGVTWKLENYSLTDEISKNTNRSKTINLLPKSGYVIKTPDGMELGRDTFNAILKKVTLRGIPIHESIDGPEGSWMLVVWFQSACSPNYRSEYTWILNGSKHTDEQILPDPENGGAPWKSNVFLNEKVQSYSMEMADSPAEGSNFHLSVHNSTR